MYKLFKKIFNPDGKIKLMTEDEMIESLILQGALEIAGLDENSNILYSFTPKMAEINPELHKQHLNSVNQEVMYLWEKGFLNVSFFDNDPVVTLTEKAFNNTELSILSKEDLWSLQEIKRILKTKEL